MPRWFVRGRGAGWGSASRRAKPAKEPLLSDPALHWSDEQLGVIEAGEPQFVVSAAAGAGKTSVLTARYLRHVVEDGLEPDQILTITFTKKAAAEMKRRIVKTLRREGLMREAQIAETGPIQTIHSFCERLLRENALEAGLDPEFDIMAEARSARLVTECVREALASNLEEEPQAEALISYLAGQRRFSTGQSPYALLEEAVKRVLSEMRSSSYSQLQLKQWHLEPPALRARWEEALIAEQPEPVRNAVLNVGGDSIQERLQLAYKGCDLKVPAWMRGKPDLEAEDEALRHTCGLVQLACAAWWRLDREMEGTQELDFTALEERAKRLLERSEATRERIRRQYAVAMVDEAQDVNPLQYKLLESMGLGRLMMVGDVQQSIYSFRQADVELFQRRAEEVRTLRLSRNYRSTPGILNFVDLVFGRLWSDRYRPMNAPAGPMDFDDVSLPDYEGVELWKQAAQDANATATYVQELLDEGEQPGDICVLVRDGGGAARMKEGFDGVGIPCRIAGGSERFYTRLEVRDLANALRAVADPHDDFSLLACLRSPMVGLSLDSVVLLGTEPNVIDRLSEFEPPLVEDLAKLDSFRRWYLPLKDYADRLSAWEVLAELFAKSDYLTALARRPEAQQLLANVRKLLALAAKEPELGPLEYAERIREIQDLRHQEGDAPAGEEDTKVVTIQTIHKAKGLEFPVVILPQTDKRLASNTPEVVVEPRKGLIATKFGKGQCLMHKFLGETRKQRAVEEELRVLYVALTRAKRRLCIVLVPNTSKDTVSKRLRALLGDGPLPGVVVRDSQDVSPTGAVL